MKLPSQLVELGIALELDCDNWEFTWTLRDKMRLFSNPKGDKLVLMYFPKSSKAVKHPKNKKTQDFSKAKGLYSRFQGFKSDKIAGYHIEDTKLTRVGSGNYICYRSDKWGKPRIDYKHDFKCSPAVWVDSIYPHIIVVSSSKLRVTRLGIEG
jgi:hypothetical protein